MKYALVTLTDNNFFIGSQVMIKSFLVSNLSWFDGHIHILSNNLKNNFKKQLHKLYNKTIIKEVKHDDYKNLKRNCNLKHENTYYKYDIFDINNYDFIVFLDSDTIVLKSIHALFTCPNYIKVGYDYDNKDGENQFNSGVMVVNLHSTKELKKELLNSTNNRDWHNHGEQTVLNDVVKNPEIFSARKYNCLKSWYRYAGTWMAQAHILHYIGKKPWQTYDPTIHFKGDLECLINEKIWINFYEKYLAQN